MHIKHKKVWVSIGLSVTMAFSTGGLLPNASSAYAAEAAAASKADQVIETGKNFLGVPYKFGAKSGITNEFDCSSFTQYAFAQNGIDIPRTSRKQSTAGEFVPRDQLQPGDLVFFYSPIHHVGIYIGDGKVLHTYGKPGVTISDMNSGWWDSHYTTARRVIPANG